MKIGSIFLLVCLSRGSVHGACEDPVQKVLYSKDFENDINAGFDETGHTCSDLSNLNESSDDDSESLLNTLNSFIEDSSYSPPLPADDVTEPSNQDRRLPTPYEHPWTWMYNWKNQWLPYGMSYYNNQPTSREELSDYEIALPYVYGSKLASYNPFPPINTLPPVYSTRIHETAPYSLDENYGDMLEQDLSLFPQSARLARSEPDDLMTQLAHDRVMPNLLPTMSLPFRRTSDVPIYKPRSGVKPTYQSHPHSETPLVALFPSRAYIDCDLPFLPNCYPNIPHEYLGRRGYGGYPGYPEYPGYPTSQPAIPSNVYPK